ncbi:MAG: LON peptidase substrate-binding domain-containing protein, partial [Deltaproteobacteria bacterium]|nr:LON peptidase substrate-binding domain-containing protein [Deltaproteobacteria bacterium]
MASDMMDDDKKNESAGFRRTRRLVRRRPAGAENDRVPGSATARHEGSQPDLPLDLPVLPLRDVAVFNYMIVPLFVGREKSVQAVEAAATEGQFLLLCTQRDEQNDDPGPRDLYGIGSVVQLLRLLKMPDGRVKALVQGISRAKVCAFYENGHYLCARIEPLLEQNVLVPVVEQEALLRTAREQCEKILGLRGIPTTEIMGVLSSVDEPGRLADLIAANLRLKVTDAQEILECLDPIARLRLVITHLNRESEVASMQARIQHSAREGMDKAQKDYYLREQLKAIRRELGEGQDSDDDMDELLKALTKAGLPPDARKEADKQFKRLSSMHNDSAEAAVVRTYLDWLAELPWKKMTRDRLNIIRAKEILDEDHFGLHKIKDRILEYLSVRKLNPDSKGSILCFVGPPGVGKTSLGRSIARALGRKFQRLSLGGIRDEAEIRGHRRTYIGAMPGRIIQAIKQAGARNPVIVLDEIDKLGSDFRGDPSSALLEVLDPEQNNSFSDHYLDLDYDLSQIFFITTANSLHAIPLPLQDRMEI